MLRKIVSALLVLVCLAAWLFASVSAKARKPPENNPARWSENRPIAGKSKVVACIGDSITHGRVSHNYVDLLSGRFPPGQFSFVNAGINSELAWNVLQRLESIIACDPDFITVLIGTNDANATLSKKNSRRAVKLMKLPHPPTLSWYRENLERICVALKKRTRAKIALLSLPPIGESPGSAAWNQSCRFSGMIRSVAAEQGTAYLPLNETMTRYIEEKKHRPRLTDAADFEIMTYKGVFAHFVLGKSFDEISRSNGFLLVTDFLHLNRRGAAMAADLIEGFVQGYGRLAPRFSGCEP